MPQANTSTLEQRVLNLALRMRRAEQLVQEEHELGCPLNTFNMEISEAPVCVRGCQVARFPTLRELCPKCGGSGWKQQELGLPCVTCGGKEPIPRMFHPWTAGRGWLPVVTTDALLEAIWSAGFRISYWTPNQVTIQKGVFHGEEFIGEGDKAEALVLALSAALGIEETP